MIKIVGVVLDSKLTFEKHYKIVLGKTIETIWLLRKLQNLVPGAPLITSC